MPSSSSYVDCFAAWPAAAMPSVLVFCLPFLLLPACCEGKLVPSFYIFFIFLLLRLPVFNGLPMKIFFSQHMKGGRVHQGTLGRWPYIFPVFTCVLASPFFVPSRRGIPGSSAIAPPPPPPFHTRTEGTSSHTPSMLSKLSPARLTRRRRRRRCRHSGAASRAVKKSQVGEKRGTEE